MENIIIPEQNSFCFGKLIATNIIPFTGFISANIYRRMLVDDIFTDFSKTFDFVYHPALIHCF